MFLPFKFGLGLSFLMSSLQFFSPQKPFMFDFNLAYVTKGKNFEEVEVHFNKSADIIATVRIYSPIEENEM